MLPQLIAAAFIGWLLSEDEPKKPAEKSEKKPPAEEKPEKKPKKEDAE